MAKKAIKIVDVHVLLPCTTADKYGLIQKYRDLVDEHVLQCAVCREAVMAFTQDLPKLRARMTVHGKPLEKLERGQCLPCGCVVLDASWTLAQARDEFYKALAAIMGVPEDKVVRMSDATRIVDLPLDTTSLRRLRDTFWIPDGSYGSAELRDKEEGGTVLQLPKTIGEFVNQIRSVHSGTSIAECRDCWTPG